VQLFAAPYAKRPLLAGEAEAAPAATNTGGADNWGLYESINGDAGNLNLLPLLM
jgi:hypothetical protein